MRLMLISASQYLWMLACEAWLYLRLLARVGVPILRRSVRRELRTLRRSIAAHGGPGAWVADGITAACGSWPFVLVHAVWFTVWLALRLDINRLTLIVSLEAIFLECFVMMSQNRQAARDRARDDREAREVDDLAAAILPNPAPQDAPISRP